MTTAHYSTSAAAFSVFFHGRLPPAARRPSSRSIPSFPRTANPGVRSVSVARSPSLRGRDGDGDEGPASPASPGAGAKDWFADGRDAARRLRLELGIANDETDGTAGSDDVEGTEKSRFATSGDVWEGGRAAALALLREMNENDVFSDAGAAGDPVEGGDANGEDGDATMQQQLATKSAASNGNDVLESGRAAALELLKETNESDVSHAGAMGDSIEGKDANENNDDATMQQQLATDASDERTPSDPPSADDPFDMPSRKSHRTTVCLVPPPSATTAWERLAAVRRECRDPGFYRWPPHVNLAYPFLEPAYDEGSGEEGRDVQRSRFREEVALHLKKAAEQCGPFDVTIDSFGTFGGKRRGVLWADPKSHRPQNDEEEEEEPLIRLHGALERQFPTCKDQRKGGAYRPHMTVSHYENVDDAAAAKDEVEAAWNSVSFRVPAIYWLEREGDDGQFRRIATIPLGVGSEEVELHDPPIAFPGMPEAEEGWVYEERKAMQQRRKSGGRRRRRGGGRSKEKGPSQESPQKEVRDANPPSP